MIPNCRTSVGASCGKPPGTLWQISWSSLTQNRKNARQHHDHCALYVGQSMCCFESLDSRARPWLVPANHDIFTWSSTKSKLHAFQSESIPKFGSAHAENLVLDSRTSINFQVIPIHCQRGSKWISLAKFKTGKGGTCSASDSRGASEGRP